jgi:hypothetical protein
MQEVDDITQAARIMRVRYWDVEKPDPKFPVIRGDPMVPAEAPAAGSPIPAASASVSMQSRRRMAFLLAWGV